MKPGFFIAELNLRPFPKRAASGKRDMPERLLKLYDLLENEKRLQILRQFGEEAGYSIDELVLGNLLAQRFAVFPMIGSRTHKAGMRAGNICWDPALAERLRPLRSF